MVSTAVRPLWLAVAAAGLAAGTCPAAAASQTPPAAVAATHALPIAAPESVGMSAAGLARIDSLMLDYVRRGRIAGVVTLVARDGRIVHLSAHGTRDLATGEPMGTDAIFRIASQTKALTSVAAMMLVEEGKLALDEPVSTYLPAFREMVVGTPAGDSLAIEPSRRAPTIRELLTHTSGISYGTEPHLADLYRDAGLYSWYYADESRTMADLVRRLPELPLAAHPGERWIYGLSTDVLGVVVETVAGASLRDVLDERIVRPLGMRDTHFHLPAEKAGRLAAVHAIDEDGDVTRAPERGRTGQGEYVRGPGVAFSGGAGLLSTASDYARFLQMMLDGGELHGVRLLETETVREMTRNQVGALYVAPGNGFGLGFEVRLNPEGPAGWDVPLRAAAGSFAWGGAYHSNYWVDPQNRIIGIFLTQHIPATGLDLREQFRDLVYDAIRAPSR